MRVTGFINALFGVIRRDGVYYMWPEMLMEEFENVAEVQAFCQEARLYWACAYPRNPELHIFLLSPDDRLINS